jgi:hypothetical protein
LQIVPDTSGDLEGHRLFWRTLGAMDSRSYRAFHARYSPDRPIPYSSEAMRQDLQRVRNTWADCQASRDRDAIYAYLTAVHGLVAWWAAEGCEIDRASQALRLQRLDAFACQDPFAAIIRCTADPRKAGKRTRSKWSRVMRYAAFYKDCSEPLGEFIKRKGGINKCAARFSRAPRTTCRNRSPASAKH